MRNSFISFRTAGFEFGSDSISIVAVQEVYHTFSSNETDYSIRFRCFFFVDGCDWTYTHDVINRFSKIDYTRMFNDLQSLLYDSSNSSVTQFYSQNNTTNCDTDICPSIVYENSTNIN